MENFNDYLVSLSDEQTDKRINLIGCCIHNIYNLNMQQLDAVDTLLQEIYCGTINVNDLLTFADAMK